MRVGVMLGVTVETFRGVFFLVIDFRSRALVECHSHTRLQMLMMNEMMSDLRVEVYA